MQGSHGRMSGRSHRRQWRTLSVIEPDDNELPGQTNAANGRTRSTPPSQPSGTLRRLKWNEVVWFGNFGADERLGFELWEAPGVFRAGSFTRPIYRKRPKDSDRPQPENQNKTLNIAMKTPKITARASVPFWENHNLPYEDRDIINNLFNYTEMLEKSG